MNLLKDCLISECHAPVALADDTDVNTDRLDMSGYDGVVFIVPVEDSVDTGVATITVEQNTADSDTGMAALAGAIATDTSAADDDLNNKLLIVDVYRPRERYVQAAITSGTANIAFGTAIAIRYKGSKSPITADATVLQATSVFGPAES